jgi:hypothetical protein
MKITVQITVKSEEAESEVVREVARLERGPLQFETLGLSLAPSPIDSGRPGADPGGAGVGGIYRPSAAMPLLRPGTRVQGAPPNCVPYAFRQIEVG